MTSGVLVYDEYMDTNTAQAARVEDNAFKVAIMNELKAHDLDVRSFDTGEHDLGISADVITVGLGYENLAHGLAGEYILWRSIIGKHNAGGDDTRRQLIAVGNAHGVTYQSAVTGNVRTDPVYNWTGK